MGAALSTLEIGRRCVRPQLAFRSGNRAGVKASVYEVPFAVPLRTLRNSCGRFDGAQKRGFCMRSKVKIPLQPSFTSYFTGAFTRLCSLKPEGTSGCGASLPIWGGRRGRGRVGSDPGFWRPVPPQSLVLAPAVAVGVAPDSTAFRRAHCDSVFVG